MGGMWVITARSVMCAKTENNKLGRSKAELHPIPVIAVWDQISIDLIGTIVIQRYGT